MDFNEEYNELNPPKWLQRLAQERLDLSVSVEETLEDSVSEALHWQEITCEDGQTSTMQVAKEKTIIPPKLSLQSRLLSVVPKRKGLLAKENIIQTPPSPKQGGEERKRVQGRQRLAGRSTKIRLETVTIPVTPTTEALHLSKAEKLEDVICAGKTEKLEDAMFVGEVVQEEFVDIPKTPLEGSVSATARGALFGIGTFECGQSDVVIANASITAASVVSVTLTANPGPVAIHYISLQPQIGFTVHLTAPAAKRTPFNYIVLLGELF